MFENLNTIFTEGKAHFQYKSGYQELLYLVPYLIALESCKQALC
jgi:hypothetical protein